MFACMCVSHFSRIWLFAILWTVAHQAPLSRQEYWSGWPCPPPGELPDSRIGLASPVAPALQADSLVLSHQRNTLHVLLLFGISVVSNSLRPHGWQHTRLPCPSPSLLLKLMSTESVMPSNHFVLCHPFLLLLQSFPASGSFLISQLFASGGQSIGASVSATVLLMTIQGYFPLGLTDLISLLSKGLFSNPTVQKHQFFSTQPSLWSNSHIHTRLWEKL